MKISMAGVDFETAGVEMRELFCFTSLHDALVAAGRSCVIIATCNRTELWLSGDGAAELLCKLAGLDFASYKNVLVCREGLAAAEHLFRMAGGLKSLIFAENEILFQIKDSIAEARKAKSLDVVLERLFQTALSVAKRIKTDTGLSRANPSTAVAVLAFIKKYFSDASDASGASDLSGLSCLVIGSGVVGRAVAELLVKESCNVFATLRNHSQNVIPHKCKTLSYDERYNALLSFDIVISATKSPHITLDFEHIKTIWDNKERLFLDLAIPRDIDNKIKNLCGAHLFNIDEIVLEHDTENEDDLKKADVIIGEALLDFEKWNDFRLNLDNIRFVQDAVAQSVENASLNNNAYDNAKNIAGRLLFALKDKLDKDDWKRCFDALKNAAEDLISDCKPDCKSDCKSDYESDCKNEGVHKFLEAPSHDRCIAGGEFLETKNEWFPVFESIKNKNVLICGGGKIALRRLKSLLNFDCKIKIIAREVCGEIEDIAARQCINIEKREYKDGDCKADFVIAATSDRMINHNIANECKQKGIRVSVADSRSESTIYFPAIIVRDNIIIALSSGGTDHQKLKRYSEKVRNILK